MDPKHCWWECHQAMLVRVWRKGTPCTAHGNVNWCSHTETRAPPATHPEEMKLHLKMAPTSACSLPHYPYDSRYRNNLSVDEWINVIHTHIQSVTFIKGKSAIPNNIDELGTLCQQKKARHRKTCMISLNFTVATHNRCHTVHIFNPKYTYNFNL